MEKQKNETRITEHLVAVGVDSLFLYLTFSSFHQQTLPETKFDELN